MGLFGILRRWLFGSPAPARGELPRPRVKRIARLEPLRRRVAQSAARPAPADEVDHLPYRFARYGVRRGGYLDLSQDGDELRLAQFGLPVFHTPEELARWLNRPLGQVAWLTYRFVAGRGPENERSAHYHYRWRGKRSGGWRLIEAPKAHLKAAQTQILCEVLEQIPPHPAAHGFVRERSILTNAEPHIASRVVVKFDLENFYATVGFNRVVAIFRSVGYSREAALWLARLTTSMAPMGLAFPPGHPEAIRPYRRRHLPQGAPTSPALANLSAFGLDVRLAGLADSFGGRYTRYADDLTFSGGEQFRRGLQTFLPLAAQVVRSERFRLNRAKRQVLRESSRQVVTGVVVNRHANVPRREYDRLKAILTNCLRHGPASQNRAGHANFAAHLQGRIAHVAHLNPTRGAKLLAMYRRVDWSR